MNDPPKQGKPEHSRQDELQNCLEQSALQQLAETRHEQAAESGKDVSRGTLS